MGEEAEIPGFETKPMPFGKFINKEFVVMMTDIRKSSEIIAGLNGEEVMFKIFYAYSGVVANIVDKNFGTSTEFLGDGIINLFEVDYNLDESFRRSMCSARDILFARKNILNPIFLANNLPQIDIGIGIDHGLTIVTRFGHKTDNDLKAFGKCVYNVTKLSKGINNIMTSESAQINWPVGEGGQINFLPSNDSEGNFAYQIYDRAAD
ncbi:MAG: hypothetical protein IPL12_11650 [Bacteroidetes bacterium]|nr:hypothetical protein [Bacteroidota bacterium]